MLVLFPAYVLQTVENNLPDEEKKSLSFIY